MNHQLPLSILLNNEATLSDFCWRTNQILKMQIHKTLNGEDRLLYIWGQSGSGKSHILQACCQETDKQKPAAYLPLKMLKEFGPEVLEGIEEQSLICLDDIDVICGDSAWEEGLFHFYNKIRDYQNASLIISSQMSPTHIPITLPDLKSRLSWGLVYQVNELDEESKAHVLQTLAEKRGFNLSESVIQFIISRASRNMHDLEMLLNKLDEASLVMQRKITIPFVKQVLDL